jgi:DNA-directed RNA polymerase specialized sigma54-like protein
MKLKSALLLTGLLFSIMVSKAQVKFLKTADEVKSLSQRSSTYFKDNKMKEFFKEIRQYWPLPENEIDGLEEKTIQGMNILQSRYGKTESSVKISEEVIKDFAIRETYIVKFENSAARLIYTYYKNNNGWILNGFKWDDNFTSEFK